VRELERRRQHRHRAVGIRDHADALRPRTHAAQAADHAQRWRRAAGVLAVMAADGDADEVGLALVRANRRDLHLGLRGEGREQFRDTLARGESAVDARQDLKGVGQAHAARLTPP
jgi:hypothetical protein